MADDKTTKMPEQPVTDTGPGKETPPEPEKAPTPPEAEKKTEQQAKSPQVSVYDFAEIMKGKKAEERAAASGGEKPAPAKTEKPEKQPEAPKKAEGKQEKPKEPEQPKRRGRPPKEDKDKVAAPKPKAPIQKKQEKAPKEKTEKKAAPTVQAAPAPKEPEGPKEAPRRGEEQIVYIKLNELHAFKNHPFEVRDDEEMRATSCLCPISGRTISNFHVDFSLSARHRAMGGGSYHQVAFCHISVISILDVGRKVMHGVAVSVDFPDADTRHAPLGIVVQPQFYRGDLRVLAQKFLQGQRFFAGG